MKPLIVVCLLAACGDNLPRPAEPFCDAWHQWGGNPAHTGESCSTGQPLERVLADILMDPLVTDETNNFKGDLFVHYQTPLLAGDSVYMLHKSGVFTPCVPNPDPTMQCSQPVDLHRFDTQIWSEAAYAWEGDTLVPTWTFESDWKPPPGNETMFQPALVGTYVAIPMAHGAIALVDAQSGQLVKTVAPFADDAHTYVVGALAVDHEFVYYNAAQIDYDDPFDVPIHASLVAISTDGDVRTADYASLVPDAPAADDQCAGYYNSQDTKLPWPPLGSDGQPILPKTYPCGVQIPGFNSAPAIAFDGTLYVASHAQYNDAYSYLTAVNPGSLNASWSSSLRDRLHDGCGVDIPYRADAPSTVFELCTDGAPMGIDPHTGLLPAALVNDGSSSSPVALPHGGVLYGALTFYNEERGHTVALDADGRFVASYDFGWDVTPAVASDPTGDRVYVKDNHYFGTDFNGGPYWLTELDASLREIWQFQSTEINSCTRQPDGTITCKPDHPNGFEWCINAPAVDREGTMYGNSEDGNLYAIRSNGELRDRFFLGTALGASYTPLAIDPAGRIYALNAGHMYVVGAN